MRRLRLLIVDDSPVERMMLSRAARALDCFDVIEADNGALALKKCQVLLPDIVLSDFEMPIVDGPTFIAGLRQLDGGDKVMVALLTGHDGESTVIAGLDAGADEYLFKPLRIPEVQARLKALSRLARLQLGLSVALDEVHALQSLRIAQQRSRLASFLSQGLSHEMNSPLQALQSNIAFLQDTLSQNDPDVAGALEDCIELVQRLDAATQRLMDFQKVKDGAQPQRVALRAVLDEVLEHRPCRVECAPDEHAHVDPLHLRIALSAVLEAMAERGATDLALSVTAARIWVSGKFDRAPNAELMNQLLEGAFDDRHLSRTKAEFGLLMAQDTLRQNHASMRFCAIDDTCFGATINLSTQ